MPFRAVARAVGVAPFARARVARVPAHTTPACTALRSACPRARGGTASARTYAVSPRTVALPPDGGPARTAAQVLHDACPEDDGLFFAARDERGMPVSLGDRVDALPRRPTCLTFLPFGADDLLATRAFWLSSACVLSAALARAVDGMLVTSAPVVHAGRDVDAASGYVLEAARAARVDTVPIGTDLAACARHARAALDTLFAQDAAPSLAAEEIARAEKEMKTLCQGKHTFVREDVPFADAWRLLERNPLQLHELVQYADARQPEPEGRARDALPTLRVPVVRLEKLAWASLWLSDDTVPLRHTRGIKAARVLGWSTAAPPASLSAPAHGARLPQPLLRVRGISFPSAADMQAFAERVAESERSDHRALGTAQSLFFAHESSPGSPFVLPHGMRVLRRVERVIRDLYDVFGYEEVQTPQLYRRALWQQSGHWDKYREDMFSAQGFADARAGSPCCDAHADEFGLKPMNCPGHCVMFASRPRSYRELPLRLAEFSPLHRNEASGALSGLTRVRRFHQDDAHVFCTPPQVAAEIEAMLHMLALAYRVFGFGDRFELVLSTRPDSFLGELDAWNAAEASLKAALESSGRAWTLNAGDGAFYGPKIDIRLVDAMGRRHQTATIQLDFQLPERFQLAYEQPAEARDDAPGAQPAERHARPVMIHRAILGSFERFLAILLEQCRGWWPFWLNPRQAVVVPVFGGADRADHARIAAYAATVQRTLQGGHEAARDVAAQPDPFPRAAAAHAGVPLPARTRFHVELPPAYLSASGDTLGKKIRHAQLARYSFVVVVGRQEVDSGTVNLRLRDEKAAPAWHAAAQEPGETRARKVQDLIVDVVRATFPERAPAQGASPVDLGAWPLADVRRLFCVLDALHV
ncbi:threonine--tRNA ligase [Malassezia sp. CBS 17886]|nr:threonine--tRNA ligase [Malassezia sp. CBS 17886]